MNASELKTLAKAMIDQDKARDDAFDAYRAMYNMQWAMPNEMDRLEWVHKYTASEPHDAVSTGVRVLSSLRARIKKHPLVPDQLNKQKANADEKVLAWQLYAADRKRSVSVVTDVVQSALLYAAQAICVIDLENQKRAVKALGLDTKRIDMALQQSRFVVNVYNPRDVHVSRSSYGVDAVLLAQERSVKEVYREWRQEALKPLAEKEQDTKVRYYDYIDQDYRAVWVGDTATPGVEEMLMIMAPTKHELDFIPWVALMGGSGLECDADKQYHPMLYPMYFSRSWETLNMLRTMVMSEAIAYFASPRISDEGPNPVDAYVEYGEPLRMAKPAPGNTLRPLAPPGLDQGLQELSDRVSSDIQRATVSKILQGGDLPSGTAYSTLNLATQTAVGALKPAKELAEKSLAEMFKIMLMWTKHSGSDLYAYSTDNKAADYGTTYVIRADEIDPSALYIDVELSPDVPTDRMQRANAGAIMVQYGYPRESFLEDLGVDDPQEAMRQWYYERWLEHVWSMMTEKEKMEMQGQFQQAQAMQQMAMQQAMAQPQQGMTGGAPPQMGGMPQGMPPMEGGMQDGMPAVDMASLLQGQGYNPAMGGTPAVMAAPPEATLREAVNGRDRMGMPAMPPEAFS